MSQDPIDHRHQHDRSEETDGNDEPVAFDGTPLDQLEEERRERLDPEKRPENAQVDNSGREFDMEKAMFTDEPGYDEAEKQFPPANEQGA